MSIRVIRHDLPREEKVKNPHRRRIAKKQGGSPHMTYLVPTEETTRFCCVEDVYKGLEAGLVKTLVPDPGPKVEMVEGPMGMEERLA